jgi:hypothetical protein
MRATIVEIVGHDVFSEGHTEALQQGHKSAPNLLTIQKWAFKRQH